MRLHPAERRYVRLDVHADVELTDAVTPQVRIGSAAWAPWAWSGAAAVGDFTDPRTGKRVTGWTRPCRALLAGPSFTAAEGDPYPSTVVPSGTHTVSLRLLGVGAEVAIEPAPESIQVY